ncbi:hypothetical protein 10S6_9 [uncultured Caudovirales phage]|uniref:YNCE-like beta-propeller domain-containing protein n=1 Tax=uncultured Caudovirales phage TaxID=2100421 RepID=A0A2H4JCI3_9CAUD|nr:hypothetical protein 10S6_9 [uncultured Caudovirales phage]
MPDIDDPYHIGFSPDQKWFVVTGNRLDRADLYRWDGRALQPARPLPPGPTPTHTATPPASPRARDRAPHQGHRPTAPPANRRIPATPPPAHSCTRPPHARRTHDA